MHQDGMHLTSDLRSHPVNAQFDLNQLIDRLITFERREYQHRGITVLLSLDPQLPPTLADARQIECVLLTLFAHSYRAIREAQKLHGMVTVTTALKAGKIQFSITHGVADASDVTFAAFGTRRFEDYMKLTSCAEIVLEQDGEIYAWRQYDPPSMTIIMDLPADGSCKHMRRIPVDGTNGERVLNHIC